MIHKLISIVACITLATLLAGCGSLNPYPSGRPGWHSANYGILFGRLNRTIGHHRVWTLRYAGIADNDAFGGRFILTPPGRMAGFSPGQQVEVFGHPLPKNKGSPGFGTLYQVQAIRLWLGTGHNSSLTR